MSEQPKTDHQRMTIILTGMGIAGGLAGASIFLPDNAMKVEVIIGSVISFIAGFLAGGKKA